MIKYAFREIDYSVFALYSYDFDSPHGLIRYRFKDHMSRDLLIQRAEKISLDEYHNILYTSCTFYEMYARMRELLFAHDLLTHIQTITYESRHDTESLPANIDVGMIQ